MRQVLLQGARILDPMNNVDLIGELLIREGKVAAIGKNLSSDLKQETEVISLEGLVLCPGLIDMHVHLREPGQTAKETIKTGTQAAARGGITSICIILYMEKPISAIGEIYFYKEEPLWRATIRKTMAFVSGKKRMRCSAPTLMRITRRSTKH